MVFPWEKVICHQPIPVKRSGQGIDESEKLEAASPPYFFRWKSAKIKSSAPEAAARPSLGHECFGRQECMEKTKLI